MKKYILFLLAAASIAFIACSELENDSRIDSPTAPSALSNVATSARIGSVVFTWDNPTSGDYYYTLVEFERDGEKVTHKISRYAVSPTLGEGHTRYIYEGFDDTDTYTFTLTPYSSDGQAGPSQTVTGAAEDALMAYKYIGETVTVDPEVEGAKVSWTNEYHREVTVNVTYTDLTGATKTLSRTGATDGSVSIGAFTDSTTITVTASNGSAVSDPYTFSVTPATGEIPASRMSINEYSSVWAPGYGLNNVLDRNMSTYWHSALNGGSQWFTVDLGFLHKVNAVEVIRRQTDSGYGSPLKQVRVSVSQDDENWTVVHYGDYDASYVYATHLWTFDEQVCRYIKVEVQAEGNWAHVAEFLAYYSSDAKSASPYAEFASAELAPDPDDDPTVYPDVEYLAPSSSNANQLKYYQPEDASNETEWVYESLGGDPFVPLVPLKADAEGPVLVFQYKINMTMNCEFFWCPGGYGVGGPNPGKETFFTLTKTDEWKTFKKNMASDWATHGFTGKAGDTVRFDTGTASGVVLRIRNMHWRAANDDD